MEHNEEMINNVTQFTNEMIEHFQKFSIDNKIGDQYNFFSIVLANTLSSLILSAKAQHDISIDKQIYAFTKTVKNLIKDKARMEKNENKMVC